MPTVQVFPDRHHFANAVASVQILKSLTGRGPSAFFTIDNVTFHPMDMTPIETAKWLREIAERIDQANEADIRRLTMDELQLIDATDDFKNGF